MEEVERFCQIMEVNLNIHHFRSSYPLKDQTLIFTQEHTEASHKFLKNYIRKFAMKGKVELNEVVNIKCTAYIIFPNS